MLPVLSGRALEDIPAGTKIDADAYLGDFRIAIGWTGSHWVMIDPGAYGPERLTDKDPAVRIGKGYWVMYNDLACICP